MTKSMTKPKHKNEKGIALIFSLIMLSLLLIMALSFALDSMFDQKAAYNSANTSSAGFSAKDQLQQVLLLLENDQANFTTLTNSSSTISASRLYSRDFYYDYSVTPIPGIYTDMLTDIMPVDSVLEYDSNTPANNDPVLDAIRVNWNYIRENDSATGRILGRTAFVVVPKEKIPLDSLISKDFDESGHTEKRIGKEVSEINIQEAYVNDAGYAITDTIIRKLNWSTAEGGVSAEGLFTGAWSSYSYLFNTIGANHSDFKTNFTSSFELDTEDDQEGFWVDLNDNKALEAGELYKRFDLTRDDWDAFSSGYDFIKEALLLTATGASPTKAMDKWKDEDSLSYNDSTSLYSQGLPWLACFGYKTDGTEDNTLSGTFANVRYRRLQIAANLRDYCDSDNTPTSDSTNWVTLEPNFTGNERTPYIDKIGIKIKAIRSYDSLTDSTTITVSARPCVGLINMYKADYTDVSINIIGKVKAEYSFGSYVDFGDFNIDDTFSITGWSNGYSTFSLGSTPADQSPDTPGDVSATVRIKSIAIRAILTDTTTGNKIDYVKTLTLDMTSSPFELNTLTTATASSTEYCWLGFEVNDPRQNINPGDWVTLTPQNDSTGTNESSCFSVNASSEGQANALNSNPKYPSSTLDVDRIPANTSDPSLYDTETNDDPAVGNLSTAYIRNAPMKSPWELGFIHRGKMWQTINLKKYYSANAIKGFQISSRDYIAGGGLYNNGDANILDQVKMTKSAKSPTKINIATQRDGILDALFSKIQLGCTIVRDNTTVFDPAAHMTIDSMAINGTTTPIDLTLANYTQTTVPKGMRTNIKEFFATPDKTNSTNLTRASVADKLSAFTGSTDAAQEELIGKVINLTKVGGQNGSGSFTIIIVAQSIKDVGGITTTIDIYKAPANGSVAQPVQCKIGTFDVKGTDPDWTKNAYGDDITATQKMVAEVTRNADGSVKVQNIQYIE